MIKAKELLGRSRPEPVKPCTSLPSAPACQGFSCRMDMPEFA